MRILKRLLAYSLPLTPHSLKFACYVTICIAVLSLSTPPTHAVSPNDLAYPVTMTASIGEPRLTLFGYTSPFAQVFLQGGTSLYAETIANSQGFFIFEKLFVLQKLNDYCLYGKDREERISNPVCLPPLPEGPFIVSIGPVVLSPTLSLSKGQFLPGDSVIASGETIPNTQTQIALFRKEKTPLFIHRIYAFSIPEYEIKSDRNGYFAFNLPSVSTNTYRLSANTFWNEKESPKSNTLTFKVLSIWEWLLIKIKLVLKLIFQSIKPSFGVVALGEMLMIIFLLKRGCGAGVLFKTYHHQRYPILI